MKVINLLFFILVIAVCSCRTNAEKTSVTEISESVVESDAVEERIEHIKHQPIPLDSLELDLELPFKYPCESTFEYVGLVKISESRWEEIQIGKGWNPKQHSCSFTWGEHIYNNFPPDTSITDFRMHLVDLDRAEIELTPEFINSRLFKEHLIVTSISGAGELKTFWDPHKTSKYPKPKQWRE
jgi:hypothetical protein